MVGSALMIISLHTGKKTHDFVRGGTLQKIRVPQISFQLSQSKPPWHRHLGYVTNSPRERTYLLQKEIYPNTIPKMEFSSPFSIENVDWVMWEKAGERNQNTITLGDFWIYNFRIYNFNYSFSYLHFEQIKWDMKPEKCKPETILISHFMWLLKHR